MIITVQGYNGKKSKSAQTACIIAGMLALKENSNTLLLQCINNDINSIENILYGKEMSKKFGTNETDFADSGIDALLRSVGSTRVGSEDFEKYCTSLTTVKNRLDITECTKTTVFEQTIMTMEDELSNILTGAKNIYDNVVILGPCDEPDTTQMLNKYADLSIYCITQGHKAAGKAFGKNIYYLVTDFEETSSINMNVIKKEYHTGGVFAKNNVLKLSRNVAVRDAAITGTLLRYIRDNRECSEFEAHYEWYKDVSKILSLINQNESEESDYSWEVQEYGTYEYGLLDPKVKAALSQRQSLAVVDKQPKDSLFKRLFGRGKTIDVTTTASSGFSTIKPPDAAPVDNFEYEESNDETYIETSEDRSEQIEVEESAENSSDELADEIIDDIAHEIKADENQLILDPKPEEEKKVTVVKKTPVKKTPAKKTTTKKATATTSKKTVSAKETTTTTSASSTAKKTVKKAGGEAEVKESDKPATKKTTAKKTSSAKKTVSKSEETTDAPKTGAKKAGSSAKVTAKTGAKKNTAVKAETEAPKEVAEKPKRVVKATAPKTGKKISAKQVTEEAV